MPFLVPEGTRGRRGRANVSAGGRLSRDTDGVYWRLALAHAPELDDDVVDALVGVALDADVAEPERVLALHRLRGARAQRKVISRRLVPVLNEPRLWLGSEAHACLAQLDDSLALGVDKNGFIAASPEPEDALARDDDGQRHCPTIGPVEALPHAGVLRRRLSAPPQWLCAPPHGGVLFGLHHAGGEFIRRLYVGADCTLGAGSFTARLPSATKVGVDVKLREGHAVVARSYAGLAPTVNGVATEDAREIEPGDVVGMAPFELVVIDFVPPRPDNVDVKDASTHGISLGAYPHSLALGQALAWTERGALERRGHVVNIGASKIGIVEETLDAQVLRVTSNEVIDLEGRPAVRQR